MGRLDYDDDGSGATMLILARMRLTYAGFHQVA